jgi:hypothetical protein
MRMDDRLSLVQRDVTAHADHFMLTVDGNLLLENIWYSYSTLP